jgi:hypothetical protein
MVPAVALAATVPKFMSANFSIEIGTISVAVVLADADDCALELKENPTITTARANNFVKFFMFCLFVFLIYFFIEL